jgi:hypothetical protein
MSRARPDPENPGRLRWGHLGHLPPDHGFAQVHVFGRFWAREKLVAVLTLLGSAFVSFSLARNQCFWYFQSLSLVAALAVQFQNSLFAE